MELKSPRNLRIISRDTDSITLATSFCASGLDQSLSPQRTEKGEWQQRLGPLLAASQELQPKTGEVAACGVLMFEAVLQ